MNESLFFGILQGLTEFLPVSSSGHLFLLERISPRIPQWNLSFSSDSFLSFIIYLHLATLFSLIIFFHKPLAKVLTHPRLLLKIAYATAVTIAGVLTWTHLFNDLFQNKVFVTIGFFLTASLLLFIRRGKDKTAEELSWRDCTFIGLAQSVAILPGLSRSGITIIALLTRGFTRRDAFTLSFLLAVPTIAAAFVYKLPQLTHSQISYPTLAISFTGALVSGLIALGLLRKFLDAGKLYRFGYYCLALAILTIFL
ncbi:MAG: undecaprenyl-diphosphate phosphatase [Candidatus Omnitrophica bacterium]|nr:undecaprenyl-diphosphate phosphatase [Candidatus Omnitrophota bacterium]